MRKSSRPCSVLQTPIHNSCLIKRSTGSLGRPHALTEGVNICNTVIHPAHPVSPACCFWLLHVGGHSALASHGRERPSNLCIPSSWFLDPGICFLKKRKLPYPVTGKAFSIFVWDL